MNLWADQERSKAGASEPYLQELLEVDVGGSARVEAAPKRIYRIFECRILGHEVEQPIEPRVKTRVKQRQRLDAADAGSCPGDPEALRKAPV